MFFIKSSTLPFFSSILLYFVAGFASATDYVYLSGDSYPIEKTKEMIAIEGFVQDHIYLLGKTAERAMCDFELSYDRNGKILDTNLIVCFPDVTMEYPIIIKKMIMACPPLPVRKEGKAFITVRPN